MGICLSAASEQTAILIHGVAPPLIFVRIPAIYFRKFGYASAIQTVIAFVTLGIVRDVRVVALLTLGSFTIIGSIRAYGLPFLLMFDSTCVAGRLVTRSMSRRNGTGEPA